MRVSPAEPLRDGTTEFTFIFNVIGSVSLTVADAATDVCWDAVSTDQFIRLELLGRLLSLDAIFHSSKVGLFAFETLVILDIPKSTIPTVNLFDRVMHASF